MKIIYDLGSNNGDDIPYYLLKADLIVAVEANPVMVDIIKTRFAPEIAAGRVAVESCVVTVNSTESAVPFYIHRERSFESQFPRPAEDRISEYDQISVPSRSLIEIIKNYGTPHYVKIDVEYYDNILLNGLFDNKIFPAYVSAEAHEIDIFATLISRGRYKAFKLVDGPSVAHFYSDRKVITSAGLIDYSFPLHSAGPFGNDIEGPWFTASAFFKLLADAGLGWKDIHASNVDLPNT